LVAELARGGEARADAHRLVELVGELPPRGGWVRIGEDHQTPRVGAEIDNGDLTRTVAALTRGGRRSPAHASIMGARPDGSPPAIRHSARRSAGREPGP